MDELNGWGHQHATDNIGEIHLPKELSIRAFADVIQIAAVLTAVRGVSIAQPDLSNSNCTNSNSRC